MGIDHIDIESIDNSTSPVTLWGASIPSNRDRDEYIKSCFFTNTISVANDNTERIHRVPISESLLREVVFPLDTKTTGSLLLCATVPYTKKMFVIQVFNDTASYTSGGEHVSVIKKSFAGKTVELILDANTGSIDLNVDSDTDGGEVNITVSNQKRTGSLNVIVNGDVNLSNDGNINITSSKAISLLTTDNESASKVTILKDKIQDNDGEEPILLGNKTVDLLSQLLDQLAKESVGPYPLLGQQVYSQIKQDIEELKSKLSFIK